MAFAIFLNSSDLSMLAGRVRDNRLPNKVRQDGAIYWTGGLSNWQTAPKWPVAYPGYENDPDGRIVVISGSSLDAFRTYLYTTAADFPSVADWVRKMADWFGDHWGAVEPWPYTPGLDPWAGYIRLPAPPSTTTTTTTTLPPGPTSTTTTAHPIG